MTNCLNNWLKENKSKPYLQELLFQELFGLGCMTSLNWKKRKKEGRKEGRMKERKKKKALLHFVFPFQFLSQNGWGNFKQQLSQPCTEAQCDKVMQRWWMNVQSIQHNAAGCWDSERVMQTEKMKGSKNFHWEMKRNRSICVWYFIPWYFKVCHYF